MEALRSEKALLEKTLADERVAHSGDAAPVAALQSTIVRNPLILLLYVLIFRQASLTEERDKLLAEKSSWSTSAAPADPSQMPQQWDAEKNELVKARDEALTQAKVCRLIEFLY